MLGFSCQQTFFKYPNNAKPCTLAVIVTNDTAGTKQITEMKRIALIITITIFTLTSCNGQ